MTNQQAEQASDAMQHSAPNALADAAAAPVAQTAGSPDPNSSASTSTFRLDASVSPAIIGYSQLSKRCSASTGIAVFRSVRQ